MAYAAIQAARGLMPLYVGLMSGTSLDGIDVAVASFDGEGERPTRSGLVAYRAHPYEPAFRDRLRDACAAGSSESLCDLGFRLGERFAAAALQTLKDAGISRERVAAVGSHGQTVWHEPPGGDRPGSTLQIGEAAVVAERTGLTVISDFRVRDVAAGGHGAPLTAYFDRLLLSSERRSRVILNLGGMANLTALPATGSDAAPLAFDTGPGVALLDAAARRLTSGRLEFDEDGRLAAEGDVDEAALSEWSEDPFFSEAPPRSTGRERFGDPRLEGWMERHRDLGAADLMATLTELTARAVGEALGLLPFSPHEVYLCGGGARNPSLRRRLAARLDPLPIRGLEELGWDPDAREAAAFALLARQHLLGFPAGPAWATGARGPRLLGKRVPA